MRPKRTQAGPRRAAPFLGKSASAAEAVRLGRALQAGSGHVAVIGAYRATACAHVRAALVDVDTVGVVYLSAEKLEQPPSGTGNHPDLKPSADLQRVRGLMARLIEHARAVGKPAYVVIEDADAQDAAALERMRMAVECAPDAIKWLRMVLVGGERLEEILNDPSASALSSRIGARVRLPSSPQLATSNERSPVATYVAAAAIAVALVSITVWSYAPDEDARDVARSVVANSAPPSGPSVEQQALAQAAPKKAAEVEVASATAPAAAEVARSTALVETPVAIDVTPSASPGQTPVEAEVARSAAPAEKPVEVEVARSAASADKPLEVEVARSAAPAEKPAPTDVARRATSVEKPAAEQVAKTKERAPAVKVAAAPVSKPTKAAATTSAAPRVAAAAPTKSTSPTAAPKVAASRTPKVAASRSTVASRKSATQATLALSEDPEIEAATTTRQVMIEAGSFKEAERADAARRALEETFDHVLVVRLDPADGTAHYSVRLVGLETHDVAAAESELRRLGYSPTRHEVPGALARFGRKGRAFLASLF